MGTVCCRDLRRYRDHGHRVLPEVTGLAEVSGPWAPCAAGGYGTCGGIGTMGTVCCRRLRDLRRYRDHGHRWLPEVTGPAEVTGPWGTLCLWRLRDLRR